MKTDRRISSVRYNALSVSGAKSRIEGLLEEIERLERGIKEHNRAIDSELDAAMRDSMLPIEDEMLRIFEEQEEEVMRNLEGFRGVYMTVRHIEQSRTAFLTADSLLDFARWTGETASRLAGYVRGTMRKAWCMGLALLGKECVDDIIEAYVQDVIGVLMPLNEEITRTSKRKIEELVAEALEKGKDIEEIKTDFFELFASWKRHRPHGVSVFNVTYPFNNALFRLYYQQGIEFKAWVTQGDSKVRASHNEMNGVVVPLQATFDVRGVRMLYPGDLAVINSNPEEIFGCRCAIKPVLDPNEPNV